MHRSLIVAGAVALSVAGCGLIPDNSLRYREAQVLEPITVPGDMVFIGADPLYAVPQMERRLQGKGEGEDKFEAPRPPQLVAAPGEADDEEEETPAAPADNTGQAVLAKDGSGYPIIMMPTSFAWAWEKVSEALTQTDLRVTDRNRDQGVFFLTVPERYQLQPPQARLKLSHTTNGIQVAVLNEEGTALAEKASGLAILESIHGEL
ncbi:MAG: outer membrane protein assembly factor BamC [Alloalcanivorax venustensis]|uniref:outer membrane protein assembly factor BamC n=1 Tax=Alloalcanivorax venustensis TaxID=172371 RepID=UPI003298F0FA